MFRPLIYLQLIYFATHYSNNISYFSSLLLGYYSYNNAFVGVGCMAVLLIRIYCWGINNKQKINQHTQIIPKHTQTQITGGRRSSRSSTSLKGRMCKALSGSKETI